MKYVDSGNWEAHASGQEFPSILFVCPTDKLKKHISFYTKALFERAYEEKLDLFLTTKDIIQRRNENIWEKVE